MLRNTVVSQGLRGDLSPKTAKRLATAQGDVGPRGAASFAHGPYPRIYAPELESSRVLGWCGPHSGWAHGTRVRAPVADPRVGWGACRPPLAGGVDGGGAVLARCVHHMRRCECSWVSTRLLYNGKNTYVKDSTTCVRVCEVKLLHVQVKLLLVSIASASKQSS